MGKTHGKLTSRSEHAIKSCDIKNFRFIVILISNLILLILGKKSYTGFMKVDIKLQLMLDHMYISIVVNIFFYSLFSASRFFKDRGPGEW